MQTQEIKGTPYPAPADFQATRDDVRYMVSRRSLPKHPACAHLQTFDQFCAEEGLTPEYWVYVIECAEPLDSEELLDLSGEFAEPDLTKVVPAIVEDVDEWRSESPELWREYRHTLRMHIAWALIGLLTERASDYNGDPEWTK